MCTIQNSGSLRSHCFSTRSFRTRLLSSVSVRKCFQSNRINKAGSFITDKGWKKTEKLKEVTGLRSSRLVSKLKEKIYNALASGHRTYIGQRHDNMKDMGNKKKFTELKISPADSILSFKTPPLSSFKCMPK